MDPHKVIFSVSPLLRFFVPPPSPQALALAHGTWLGLQPPGPGFSPSKALKGGLGTRGWSQGMGVGTMGQGLMSHLLYSKQQQ